MSQHDLNIANQGFPAFRADLNDALQALGSCQSGTSAPSPTFANQLWYDTTNNILKIRNEDNDAWISIVTLDQSTDAVTAIGSLTLADIVSLTGSQTLTNKTLTNPTINGFTGDSSIINIGSGQVYKDASGNVGIDTTSPAYRLQVRRAGGAGSLGINIDTIVGSARDVQHYAVADSTSGDSAHSFYVRNGSATDILSLRISQYGTLALRGGNTSATGVGIAFPATQSASSDANTLDDYEEGTWTPLSPTTGYTFASANGQYTRIGNLVYIKFAVSFSSIGGNNSAVVFQGLPYSVSNKGTGACRDDTASGAIYMVNNNGNTGVEINSMDGVSSGSQRTIRTGEQYICTFFYFV